MRLISEDELALLGISVWKTWRPSKYTGGLWWKLEDVLYIDEILQEPDIKRQICQDKWHRTQYIPFGRLKMTCSRRYLLRERESVTADAAIGKTSMQAGGPPARQRFGRQSQESLMTARTEPQWEHREEPVTCTHVALCDGKNQFAAIDLLSNLYCFDIENNIFWWVMHCPDATSLSFSSKSETIVVVGKESGRIDVVSLDLQLTIGHFFEHVYAVTQLSCIDNFCLSFSLCEIWIWDTMNYEPLYSLSFQDDLPNILAKFVQSQMTITILTLSADSSLRVWTAEKIESCSPKLKAIYYGRDFVFDGNITCIEFSKYDSVMALAGDHKKIALINVSNHNNWTTERVLTLPSNISSTKALKFLKIPNDLANKSTVEVNCLVVLGYPHNEIVIFNLDDQNGTDITQQSIDVIDIEGNPVTFDVSFDGQYAVFRTSQDFIQIYTTFWWLSRDFCHWLHFQRTPCFILEEPSVIDSERTSKSCIAYQVPGNPGELTGRALYRYVLAQKGQLERGERFSFWGLALCLPDNITAFQSIYSSGIHPACAGLQDKCLNLPIKNAIVYQRLLSVFYYWSPLFFVIKSFPKIVLHFLKLFNWRIKMTFEIVASLMQIYCFELYTNYPKSPRKIDYTINSLVKKKDEILFDHLTMHGLKASEIGWNVLSSLFIEALNMNDWLFLWDHILFTDAHYLVIAAVSLILNCRSLIFNFKSSKDLLNINSEIMNYFTEHGNVGSIVLMAYDLHFEEMKTGVIDPSFEALPKGLDYNPPEVKYNNDNVNNTVNEVFEKEMYRMIELQETLDFFRLLDPRLKLPFRKSDNDPIKTEAPDSPALNRAMTEYKQWQSRRLMSMRNKKTAKSKSLDESTEKKPGSRRYKYSHSIMKSPKGSDFNSSSDERQSSPEEQQALEELNYKNMEVERQDKFKSLQRRLRKYELVWIKSYSKRKVESEGLKHFITVEMRMQKYKTLEDKMSKGAWSYYRSLVNEVKIGLKDLNNSINKTEIIVDCYKLFNYIDDKLSLLKKVEENEEVGFEELEATDVSHFNKSSSESSSEHKDVCESINAGLKELRELIDKIWVEIDDIKSRKLVRRKASVYREFGLKGSLLLKSRSKHDQDVVFESSDSDESETETDPWKKERESAFVECLKTLDVNDLRRLWNQPVVKFNLLGD